MEMDIKIEKMRKSIKQIGVVVKKIKDAQKNEKIQLILSKS